MIRKALLIILGFSLIAFWLLSAAFLRKDFSPLTLVYKENDNQIRIVNSGNEKKIAGEFRARENNLGTIRLGFNSYIKNANDQVFFRIKEVKRNKWFYENSYKGGLLSNNEIFPLGFPSIEDSKDKIYQFEIESYGNQEALNDLGFFTSYKFSKQQILENKKVLVRFVFQKLIFPLGDLNQFLSTILYLIPLELFLLYFFRKNILKNKKYYFLLTVVLMFIDIILIYSVYIGLYAFMLVLFFYLIWKLKIKSKQLFSLAFLMTIIWIFLLLFNISEFQNKLNIWIYFLLVFGIFAAIYEEKKDKRI